jgi:predicted AAA+ superfamily ATPase
MAENIFNYRKRIADILLEEKLDAMGAVLIEGPKACGKTTTAVTSKELDKYKKSYAKALEVPIDQIEEKLALLRNAKRL